MTYEENVREILECNFAGFREDIIDTAHRRICEIRTHGKWEFVGDNLFMCTHCGYSAKGDYLREWSVRTYDSTFPDFCPNCGASMVKEGDRNEM